VKVKEDDLSQKLADMNDVEGLRLTSKEDLRKERKDR
jgi:hypothetical protein